MKIKINPILLFVFVVSIIATTSCKKEQQTNTTEVISGHDLKLANMIKNFKAKGESGLKSTAEMSIDSAIWYIGATANFTYGDASRETERTWHDSIFITLPVNIGKITESEVFNKYETVIDSLRSIYQNRNEENKQLIAVTITTHSLSATSLVCKVTSIFAFGFPTIPTTFNPVDSWFFWKEIQGGICAGGINNSTTLQSDAAEETEKRIRYSHAVPAGNYWYESETIVPIIDPTLYKIDPTNNTPSNNRYCYLYWNSSQYPNFNGCINPSDLNFYLSKTKELIYNDTANNGIRPVGSSFIDIDMNGYSYTKQVQPFETIYEHQAKVYYGILHWNPNPPTPLD